MLLKKLHHAAYRCLDASETVKFYTEILGLTFAAAVTADRVPSIDMYCPYMHIFFEMADGSYIAFFEVPECDPPIKDPNTPEWVQHLALEVDDVAVLHGAKAMLESHGVSVVGPTDHDFIHSIYFFDPNGHRLEMTVRTDRPGQMQRKREEAYALLADWNDRKHNTQQKETQ